MEISLMNKGIWREEDGKYLPKIFWLLNVISEFVPMQDLKHSNVFWTQNHIYHSVLDE
jgi:hypothetical protein